MTTAPLPPIVVRRGRFHPAGPLTPAWLGDATAATAFYNALSLSFPAAERFFIETVAAFADRLPPDLAEQARAFIQQEANHAREHGAFNRLLGDMGHNLGALEGELEQVLGEARGHSPMVQVGLTAAIEHLTAILAHAILADPRHLAWARPELRRLWIWHAAEEIEHKAVAYDIFRWCTRDMPSGKAWRLRCRFGLYAVSLFVVGRWQGARMLLANAGQDTASNRWRLLVLLFVRPGLYRQCLWPWLTFFAPQFHPWQVDDRALLASAEAELARGE